MSKKTKKQAAEELPIDRMEHFLENNFKKILLGVGIILVAFVVTYLAFEGMQARKANQLNELAMMELQLLSESSALDAQQFLDLADKAPIGRDYILYMAGVRLADAGRTDEAKDMLARVGGDFVELRDSLLFDLTEGNEVSIDKYGDSAKLDAVWNYRKILAADEAAARDMAAAFAEKYPESRLADLVNNWEK